MGGPVVVVVVRCPAEPMQQEEKGCGARVGEVVKSQQSLGFHLHPGPHRNPPRPTAAQTPEAEVKVEAYMAEAGGTLGLQASPSPRCPSSPRPPQTLRGTPH